MSALPSTDELAAFLRERLLSPPPTRVTRDVEAWASGRGIDPKASHVLERYREAYEEARSEAKEALQLASTEADGRRAVIALLNRPGVSDAERVVALDALDGLIERADVGHLIATVINQRAAIAKRAAEILAEIPSGETLFALDKVIGSRGDGAAEAAHKLSGRMDGSRAPADTREALFYALARLPESRLDSDLAGAACKLDRELQASGRTAKGLSDYEQVLRDELHLLALRSDVPSGDDLGARARDTLFTRIPLDRVRELAQQLPRDVLTQYCQRALSRTQRRGKRRDRAELALELLADASDELRRECAVEMRECLAEEPLELQFGAAKALARDPESLTDADRSVIGGVYARLPAEWQERLAPELRNVLPDDVVLDVAALVRWLLAAKPDDVSDRLQAGLRRWATSGAIDAAGVAQLASTLLSLADQLEAEDRERARSLVADQISAWLAAERSEPRGAIAGLLEANRLADLICEQFWDTSLANLPSSLLRVLVPATVAAASDSDEALARLVNGADRSHRAFASILPTLLELELDVDHAFALSSPAGQGALLLSRLARIQQLAADERRLLHARDEATTEALIASRDAVLGALDAAEEASAGNEHLRRQFGAIRRAVGLVTEAAEPLAPEQRVLEWRQETATRLGDALLPTDPASPLVVNESGTNPLPELLRLVEELDRRAHARGVTAAADRSHHVADLENVVRGLLAMQGGAIPPGLVQLAGRRPELARLVWSTALPPGGSEAVTALSAALADQADARRALLQIDILLERVSEADLDAVVDQLDEAEPAVAWERTGQLHAHRRRARDAVAADVERQSEQVMENIAAELDLPFRSIESILFGYFRLRSILREAGWGQIAESLGDLVRREDLDFEKYEVVEAEPADRYVVRSLGISVRGRPVRRAIVEPLPTDRGD